MKLHIKQLLTIVSWLSVGLFANLVVADTAPVATKPVHGDYKDWRLLGVSHRLDKNTLRAILGNNAAINAARAGNLSPWPDGSILAKTVWEEKTHANWPQAVVPGNFSKAEAMIKDSKQYANTGGWGFGRWENGHLVMYDATQSAACFACHTAAKDHDYVFTLPVFQ